MKKSRYQIKNIERIIVAAICIIGILFGSFFDLKIAEKIYNPYSGFGAFFETYGESIAYARIPLGGVLIFKGTFKNQKRWMKFLGIGILVLSLLVCIYFLADSFTYKHNDYGMRLETIPAYIIASIITLTFTAIFFAIINDSNSTYLVQIGAIVLISMLLQFLIMSFLKVLACRPRYRFLVDSNLNTDGVVFHSWWQFNFHGFKSLGDSFKSWPSGHSATAAQLLLLPLIYPVLKWQWKRGRSLLFVLALVRTLVIAFSRRVYGAHFLSDVSFGVFVGALTAFLTNRTMYLIVGRKQRSAE